MIVRISWINYPGNKVLTFINKICRVLSIALGLVLMPSAVTIMLVEDIESYNIYMTCIILLVGILLAFCVPSLVDKWTNHMWEKSLRKSQNKL